MKIITRAALLLTSLLLVQPLSLAAGMLPTLAVHAQSGYPKVSPFDDLRWHKGLPDVKVDGEWYVFKAIDGVSVGTVFATIKGRWSGQPCERFAEDLYEAVSRSGHDCGKSVTLTVTRIGSDKTLELKGVSMNEAKRRFLRGKHDDGEEPKRGGASEEAPAARKLSSNDVDSDLSQLETLLTTRYSYVDSTQFDWRKALDRIRVQSRDGISYAEFALDVQAVLSHFGDGHTRVRGTVELTRGSYLPFGLEDWQGRVIAIDRAAREPLDPEKPFLIEIDGLPLDRWMAAAGRIVQKGSPQFVRSVTLERLVCLGWLRGELGLEATRNVTIVLEDEHGGRVTRFLDVAAEPRMRARSREVISSSALQGGVGYLHISQMGSGRDFGNQLQKAMEQLAGSTALIIDVRGNGGGSRQALRELYPWLAAPGSAPHVANAGYYRIPDGEKHGAPRGYLDNRFLYPTDWQGWQEDEQAVIAKFARVFQPDWTPDSERFSRLHVMLLRSAGGGRANFAGPVAILTDAGCFSATDIFVAGLAGVGQVKLYGQATGGGSGRSQPHTLSKSGVRLRISSMASFRPTGAPYDGVGIAPDIELLPTLDDLLGISDSVLERTRLDLLKRAGQ